MLGIREETSSKDAGEDGNEVRSIANTGVFKMSLVKANGLKVDPLLAPFMPYLEDDHGFPMLDLRLLRCLDRSFRRYIAVSEA